jgi:hypothetical protein
MVLAKAAERRRFIMSDERFVLDGYERLTQSSEFRAARAAVIAAVRDRYAEHLAGAGILRRLVLHLRMRREIARELAKLAPPDALYFQI